MGWMGKLLGGGLGFVLGGPIGAVIGALLGHHSIDERGGRFSALEQKQTVFFVAVFSMLGKLAKADGHVSRDEIDVIDRIIHTQLQLDAEARRFAIEVFNVAKDSAEPFEQFARQFQTQFGGAQPVLVSALEFMMLVAMADGELHTKEENYLSSAARIFGLESQFHHIRHRLRGGLDEVEQSYEILGCKEGDSLASVKKTYRRLAMQYHPDRVQAKGMSPEFAAAAEAKFKRINHAFDILEKHLAA